MQKTKVMVVDDELTMRLLVTAALEQSGFEVTEADGGLEALDRFPEQRPDIVILDVMMPGMDGFTTCERLRDLPGAKHIPVLMMTGLDDEESINRAYYAGATDFITKPINYTLLIHRLRYMQRAAETTLRLMSSEHRLANAQRIARLGHWEWDAGDDSMSWSPEVYRILGESEASPPETMSSFAGFLDWVPEQERGRVEEWYAGIRQSSDPGGFIHRILRADGSERYVRQQVEARFDEQGRVIHLYGTLQDITEIQIAEEKIRHLAYFDSLTNLPNRELFKKRVEEALALSKRHGSKGALLFLDLDNFKRINDTLGHNVGDMLLKSVARRLQESIRISDVVSRHGDQRELEHLARMGGDEFTLLLSEIQQEEDAACTATRILEYFSQPFHLSGHEVVVSPSIGITVFPHDGEDVGRLLRNGDLAMYYAKRAGKNAFNFFDESMNEVAMKRLVMENHLRKALVNGEMSVHYQPQKDMITGQISGVEALMRWHSPTLGDVPPDQFIPLAEETGLIIELGEWVLRTACVQAKSWRDANVPLKRMAVNVSVHQFVQTGFTNLVGEILADTRLEPSILELEVTEGLLMKDAEAAVKTLSTLKSLGVQLAIDDFGTGYSSLSYLKQFPIDRLKIDRKFVRDVNVDPNDAAITMAVIAMAEKMALKVTAEGVETEDQLAFLKSKNCDEVQGYLLSRPIAPEKMEEYLNRSHSRIQDQTIGQPAVLLVDDDPNTLKIHSHLLKMDGFRVLSAPNAKQGLSELAKNEIRVIISDYQMSGMNGNEFLWRVKELYPDSIRIMLSGASDKESLIESVNQGAIYKFLEKPVSSLLLRETVRMAFGSLNKSAPPESGTGETRSSQDSVLQPIAGNRG